MSTKRHITLFLAAIFVAFTNIQAQEQSQSQRETQHTQLVYGLVVDNSGSLRSQLKKVIDTGKLIVESNQSGDQTFLVRFVDSKNIRVVQGFSSNEAAFTHALDRMYVEGGVSAIIDAVYFSAQRLIENDKANNGASQRILILITDGDERHSHYKLETLLALLREKKVEVYVIGFVQGLRQQGARTEERAIRFLSKLAEESGGRAYFPDSMSEVKDIAGALLDEIRRQR